MQTNNEVSKFTLQSCLETNPKFWHSFLMWYIQWNEKKINPAEWTEGMCHEHLMEWYYTVQDRFGIHYEEVK